MKRSVCILANARTHEFFALGEASARRGAPLFEAVNSSASTSQNAHPDPSFRFKAGGKAFTTILSTRQTCWTQLREAGFTPGRTCGAHASCGASEARIGGAMSELSDADRGGSRQTRRGASMARCIASKQRVDASDEARRRESAMDARTNAGRGAGASEERRKASPNALESAKRGLSRGRSRAERFGLCRVGSHATRRHTCVCREVDGAIKSAKATSRARLPRIKPHIYRANNTTTHNHDTEHNNFRCGGCRVGLTQLVAPAGPRGRNRPTLPMPQAVLPNKNTILLRQRLRRINNERQKQTWLSQ